MRCAASPSWGGQPLPLNASAWWDGTWWCACAGALAAVNAAITAAAS